MRTVSSEGAAGPATEIPRRQGESLPRLYVLSRCGFFLAGMRAIFSATTCVVGVTELEALFRYFCDNRANPRDRICIDTRPGGGFVKTDRVIPLVRLNMPSGVRPVVVVPPAQAGDRRMRPEGHDVCRVVISRPLLAAWRTGEAGGVFTEAGNSETLPVHAMTAFSMTARELRALNWTLAGRPLSRLAQVSGVSVKTLYTQRQRALKRMGLSHWRQLSLERSDTVAVSGSGDKGGPEGIPERAGSQVRGAC